MGKKHLKPIARFLYITKALKIEFGNEWSQRYRLLHPFGLMLTIIMIVLIPFIALFTDMSVQEGYSDYFSDVVLW